MPPSQASLWPTGTCHHDGTDAGPPQSLDDCCGLRLQQVPHDQQPQEAQLLLQGVPGGWADPGQRSQGGSGPCPCLWARLSPLTPCPYPPPPWGLLAESPPPTAPATPGPEAQSPRGGGQPTSSAAEQPPGWVPRAAACRRRPPHGSQRPCSSAASGRSPGALRGEAGVTGTRAGGSPRSGHGGLPPSPVSGLQRPATSSGEPLT